MDALNTMLMLDNYMADIMSDLAPHTSATNFDGVHQLSSDIILPKPVAATVSNYMSKPPEGITTQEQADFMQTMSI